MWLINARRSNESHGRRQPGLVRLHVRDELTGLIERLVQQGDDVVVFGHVVSIPST